MSAQGFGEIRIDGLKEFQKEVRKAKDTGMGKRIGQANKSIGQLVISRLSPSPNAGAVGVGGGSVVKPSATQREVLLRVGGKHRESLSLPAPTRSKNRFALMQWGRKPLVPFQNQPDRPNIRETVERNRSEVETAYLKAVARAMRPAFDKTEPR